mmetsp:Transcript_15732/g.42975  ORF Transcript_15732/g.42975 Transcript_15732/m.42975 type:complete len:279 (+) Transcript_15732:279-1115(+)
MLLEEFQKLWRGPVVREFACWQRLVFEHGLEKAFSATGTLARLVDVEVQYAKRVELAVTTPISVVKVLLADLEETEHARASVVTKHVQHLARVSLQQAIRRRYGAPAQRLRESGPCAKSIHDLAPSLALPDHPCLVSVLCSAPYGQCRREDASLDWQTWGTAEVIQRAVRQQYPGVCCYARGHAHVLVDNCSRLHRRATLRFRLPEANPIKEGRDANRTVYGLGRKLLSNGLRQHGSFERGPQPNAQLGDCVHPQAACATGVEPAKLPLDRHSLSTAV